MFVDLQQAFENSLRKWIILIVHNGSYKTLYKATNTRPGCYYKLKFCEDNMVR